MELGEPDASGRRRPVVIKGSEFKLTVDTVIVSIGNGANPLVPSTTPGLDTNKWGNILADQETGRRARRGVRRRDMSSARPPSSSRWEPAGSGRGDPRVSENGCLVSGALSAALHNYGDVFVFDTAPRASMRRSGKARD